MTTLNFEQGAVANDGVWWPVRTRVAGRLFMASVAPADTNGVLNVGWDSGQSGAILDALQFAASGVLNVIANGGTAIAVGTYTATSYTVFAQMRATGVAWYILGGAFSAVTKLWDTAAGTAAGYPAVNVGSATTGATVSLAKVPVSPYRGQPVANDGFSGATTDGLAVEESGGAGLTWTGATWTVAAGAVSNAPTQGAELLTDGGLENWASATDLTSWTESLAGTSTVNREATTIHGGTYAVRADIDASNNQANVQQSIILAAHLWFSVTGWVRSSASGKTALFQSGAVAGPDLNPGTTWTQYTNVFRATAANPNIILKRSSAASASLYFDDISLLPLTLSTLFRSLVISTPDVLAEVAITRVAGCQAGIVLGLDSASSPANFDLIYENGAGSIVVDECRAGVYTNKSSTAITYAAGAVLRVIRRGTELRVFYANSAVGSALTMSSNTASIHGLFDTSPSLNSLDNWVCFASGSEGQYAALSGL